MKFFRFTWLRLVAFVLILLFTALAFLVGTQSGSRWLLNTVMSQINGRMVQIEGTIWSGIRSKELEINTPAVKIVAQDNALAVNWLSLLRARLHVVHIMTGDLSLTLFPTEPTVDEEESAAELSLPISIQVDKVSVGQFTMTDPQGKHLPVGLNNFDLETLVLDSNGTTAELKRLTVTHPDVKSELQGTVALEKLAYPWPMHVSLGAVNEGLHTQSPLCVDYLLGKTGDLKIQTHCQVDATVEVDGGLDDLHIKLAADGVAQGLDLNIESTLNLESTIPLKNALIDLTVAKNMRFHAEVDSEQHKVAEDFEQGVEQSFNRLTGTITTDNFMLDLLQAGSRLDSAFDFSVDFSEQAQLQALVFTGGVFRGSRWGGEALNAGVNINVDFNDVLVDEGITAWEKLRLNQADILMNLGDNTIESKGQFLSSEQSHDGLQLDVDLQDLSQLVASLNGSAEFKLNLLGNLSDHDLKAELKHNPQPAVEESLSVAEQVSLQYGLGKEPVDLHLDLLGKLSSDEGRYHWQAELQQLQAEHAGFKLVQQEETHLSFKQAESDFLFDIAEANIVLTLPGEHQGVLQHLNTQVTGSGWETEGRFSDLILDNRLLQLLGLEENLTATLAVLQAKDVKSMSVEEQQAHQQALLTAQSTIERKNQITAIAYDGSWSLNAQPSLVGLIHLNRQSGDTILPLEHPLPLDLSSISVELGSGVDEEISQMLITTHGLGEHSELNADLSLESGFAMALKKAAISLKSTDGGSLEVDVDTVRSVEQEQVQNWQATIDADAFDLNAFSLGHLPDESSLNLAGTVQATILQRDLIMNLTPDLKIESGSRWNQHDLEGQLKAKVDLSGVFALAQQRELDASLATPKWYQLKLADVETRVALDRSYINLGGDLGADSDALKLEIQIPELADWWPDTLGQVQGDVLLQGGPSQHSLSLELLYDSFLAEDQDQQPLLVNLDVGGEVVFDEATPQNWQLSLNELSASYAGLALNSLMPVQLDLHLPTDKQAFSWEVAEAELGLQYPDGRQSLIQHQYSQGQAQHWESEGALNDLAVSMTLYEYLLAIVDSFSSKKLLSPPQAINPEDELVVDADWAFKQEEQLSGHLNLQRKFTSGLWPFPTPVPLDFDYLNLQVGDSETSELPAEYAVTAGGMHISAEGQGPNSKLLADVFLHPASPFMLERAQINLTLPDSSAINSYVFTGSAGDYYENTRLYGLLQTSGIPLDKVSYGAVPPGMINGDLHFNVLLSEDNQPLQAFVTGKFLEDSRWNNQPLQGSLDFGLLFQDEHNFNLEKADINLQLGQSHIVSDGSFGRQDDSFKLSIKAPRLSDLWPDLPGSIALDLALDGSISDNQFAAKGRFSQGDFSELGKAPIDFEIRTMGGWQTLEEGYEGWAGTLEYLDVQHAGFAVTQAEAVDLSFIPQGAGAKPQWDVGASTVSIVLPGEHTIALEQGGSTGKEGKFDTQGALRGLALTPQLIADVTDALGLHLGANGQNGKSLNHGIVVRGREIPVADPPIFDLEWNLDFDGALAGTASLLNRGGDFIIPSDPPVPLGLEQLELRISSQRQGETNSLLTADLDFATQSKGNLQGSARLNLNGFSPVFDSSTEARVVGRIDDISWLTGLTGDLLELGGQVDIDVTANYRGGNWISSGGVKAEELRIVEVENGIRLLDGTLDLGLNGNDIVINRLHFPSVIRITPNEWRTRQWIEENPPAQNGSLDISGKWNLLSSRGDVNVLFDHYPILQRTDRFAMMSGEVNVDVALPRIIVDGKVTADAGWVSVDIKGTAPTLDSDVVIVRKGEEASQPSASDLDLDLSFTVDLGPRFYVVGFGLDAGLVGAITIKQAHNELTAEGQFNTRGGAIEAYGQRLQIRRGRIGFQGDITNPVLDIEALRRNLEVEAGMRVVGNARNPKISLISYPEVSEVEKLSWLIMGRGPDSGGGDLAMLLTVGTSLLGGDPASEPIHKQLGIDDIAIRKGDVGESGSILPRRTVGDSTSYEGQNDISEQFVQVSKRLKQGINASIEQALSGSGTVARVSYTLIRHLTVDAKVGTVSGIEMVYRRFFRD